MIKNIILKKKINIIFHTGAVTQVLDALKDPEYTYYNNINGTLNFLNIINKINKKIIFIYSSSDKAYGESDVLPYEETFNLNGQFPYEVSKSATDLLCKTYKATYNLNVATLRCGNIYGGGDLNWERLIPGVIRWLINNEQPILRTNGTFKRDWVYVEDVVQAYIGVGDALMDSNIKV